MKSASFPVSGDSNPSDYHDAYYDEANGVVTAYDEEGTAVTLHESTDGFWYDSDGTPYTRHSATDFQVYEGNKHLTVY